MLQGVRRVDIWLSVKKTILRGPMSKYRRNILRILKASRRNNLRRDSRKKIFSREEPTANLSINKKYPFRGIEIFPNCEIWESFTEDSL
jgi:hypothetical protein